MDWHRVTWSQYNKGDLVFKKTDVVQWSLILYYLKLDQTTTYCDLILSNAQSRNLVFFKDKIIIIELPPEEK